jgi:hypothetical protein
MRPSSAVLLLLAMSGAAAADDAAMLRCRGMGDASARLACYDAIPVQTPEEKVRQVETTQREQFGLGKPLSAAPDLDAIETSIAGHFDGWGPGTSFQLANGQVWQVNDNSSAIVSIDNPKVKIRHGVFTAYYLEFEGTNRSPRVSRVR